MLIMSILLKTFSPKENEKISNGRNEISRNTSASRAAMIMKFFTHSQCYICLRAFYMLILKVYIFMNMNCIAEYYVFS